MRKPSVFHSLRSSLSGKLLVLTLGAVMLAEVFVFVPSVANYRKTWLTDRLVAAQIAAIAADAAPGGILPDALRIELLMRAQVRSIAFRSNKQRRRLIMRADMPPVVDDFYDLTTVSRFALVADALNVFVAPRGRTIAVRGNPGFGNADFIEIVLPEAPLRRAMFNYGLNILGLSIVISLFTAGLVYLALNALLVRPMREMMRNMIRFSKNPEDATRIIEPSERADEIGRAERELSAMQNQLRQLLNQKSRLASLGLAVSKINHDLRNMLANAQLISDQFETVEHPVVRRFTPKLIKSLDRAIRLCTETLKFGQAEEAPPSRTLFDMRDLTREVGDALGIAERRGDQFQGRDPRWPLPLCRSRPVLPRAFKPGTQRQTGARVPPAGKRSGSRIYHGDRERERGRNNASCIGHRTGRAGKGSRGTFSGLPGFRPPRRHRARPCHIRRSRSRPRRRDRTSRKRRGRRLRNNPAQGRKHRRGGRVGRSPTLHEHTTPKLPTFSYLTTRSVDDLESTSQPASVTRAE